MNKKQIPKRFLIKIHIFPCRLKWHINIHPKQPRYQCRWQEYYCQTTEYSHNLILNTKVQESLLYSLNCTFNTVIVMGYAVYHELEHNLLLFVVLVVFLEFLQENGFLLHVNLKMGYLIFGVEDALDEGLAFDVVDGHSDFDDVAGVDNQLLGVREDAKQSVVNNRE